MALGSGLKSRLHKVALNVNTGPKLIRAMVKTYN